MVNQVCANASGCDELQQEDRRDSVPKAPAPQLPVWIRGGSLFASNTALASEKASVAHFSICAKPSPMSGASFKSAAAMQIQKIPQRSRCISHSSSGFDALSSSARPRWP